jgi:hypothetical protein
MAAPEGLVGCRDRGQSFVVFRRGKGDEKRTSSSLAFLVTWIDSQKLWEDFGRKLDRALREQGTK